MRDFDSQASCAVMEAIISAEQSLEEKAFVCMCKGLQRCVNLNVRNAVFGLGNRGKGSERVSERSRSA